METLNPFEMPEILTTPSDSISLIVDLPGQQTKSGAAGKLFERSNSSTSCQSFKQS
ncbi:unannotated protein [freshwater metagenome]|uniref:Unannotated protein n=1 Tax=freshwater metagenome TaxID=449393 RepID=A0A6J6HYC4_9ZZZZ